jgi:hypothetical protein
MRTFSRKNNAQERWFKYRKLEVALSSVTARGLLTDARLTKQFTHITSSSWSVGQQTKPLDHKEKNSDPRMTILFFLERSEIDRGPLFVFVKTIAF